jgi:SAM-dependent methyltransferase
MKLKRRWTQMFGFFLDELLPPILRDQRWFMWPLQRLLFGDKTRQFMDFKDEAPHLAPKAIREIYQHTAGVHIQRETDLNPDCIVAVKQAVRGDTVLDVGCGHGYLAKRLAYHFQVTATDFMADPNTSWKDQNITFVQSDVCQLPFQENSFDTVVCTHTLEHVIDLRATMNDLRKIARERLIVVVPLQRPYKYTFDLHLHFFPYPHSFLMQVGAGSGNFSTSRIGGDLFYVEDNP